MLADDTAQHLEHSLDGLVQVQHLRGDGLFAGKPEQLTGQLCRPRGRHPDHFQGPVEFRRQMVVGKGQVGVGQDHSQHVVEIVGHTPREPTNGFHFLGLIQMVLQPGPILGRCHPLGDIDNAGEQVRDSLEFIALER